MITEKHSCLITRVDERDFVKDVNSPIVFKTVAENWEDHIDFFERQKFSWETDACVIFTAQESFDAQINNQIENGQIPQWLVSQFTTLGYMDPESVDGKPRFHTSPRFIHVLAGTKLNGTSLPTPWDTMRKYGVCPWVNLPFTSDMTMDEYFAPIPQNLLDKSLVLLNLIGGKNAIQYHWITQNNTDLVKIANVLPQAPLCIGTEVCEPWNQQEPSVCSGQPLAHSTMLYKIQNGDSYILDHYNPFEKILQKGYEIPQVLQGVVTVTPLPPPPLNVQPTQQNLTLLQSLLALYQKLIALVSSTERAKLGEASRSNQWPTVRAAFLKLHPACAVCGKNQHLQVHHKKPFNKFPALELDPKNFIVLCESGGMQCHITYGHLGDFKFYNPDIEADALTWNGKVKARLPNTSNE